VSEVAKACKFLNMSLASVQKLSSMASFASILSGMISKFLHANMFLNNAKLEQVWRAPASGLPAAAKGTRATSKGRSPGAPRPCCWPLLTSTIPRTGKTWPPRIPRPTAASNSLPPTRRLLWRTENATTKNPFCARYIFVTNRND